LEHFFKEPTEMRIHHHLLKPLILLALLFLGASGSCFAECHIIAEAATETGDGIVHIPPNGVAAFAISTTNIGGSCDITVTPVPSTPSNLSATICETNPQNAVCTTPTSPISSLEFFFPAGGQPTFSIFLRATGAIPSGARVCVNFTEFIDNNPEGLIKHDGQVCVPVVTS
jgi:hypothetical protein